MRFVQKDIKEEWSKIKDKLASILFPSDSLEEIYYLCRAKQAFLFTVPEGFIILREYTEESGDRVLYVWAAYCKGLIEKYEEDLDELARAIKANKIIFRTVRKGFGKVLSDKWSMSHIEFQKRIENV